MPSTTMWSGRRSSGRQNLPGRQKFPSGSAAPPRKRSLKRLDFRGTAFAGMERGIGPLPGRAAARVTRAFHENPSTTNPSAATPTAAGPSGVGRHDRGRGQPMDAGRLGRRRRGQTPVGRFGDECRRTARRRRIDGCRVGVDGHRLDEVGPRCVGALHAGQPGRRPYLGTRST